MSFRLKKKKTAEKLNAGLGTRGLKSFEGVEARKFPY